MKNCTKQGSEEIHSRCGFIKGRDRTVGLKDFLRSIGPWRLQESMAKSLRLPAADPELENSLDPFVSNLLKPQSPGREGAYPASHSEGR